MLLPSVVLPQQARKRPNVRGMLKDLWDELRCGRRKGLTHIGRVVKPPAGSQLEGLLRRAVLPYTAPTPNLKRGEGQERGRIPHSMVP